MRWELKVNDNDNDNDLGLRGSDFDGITVYGGTLSIATDTGLPSDARCSLTFPSPGQSSRLHGCLLVPIAA